MRAARVAKVLTVSAIGALFAMVQPAAATTIGFDDLLGGGETDVQISNPYAGFTWSNFYVLNTVLYSTQRPANGYHAASLNNVGFTGFDNPASFSAAQPFQLDSYYVGAGWMDGMSVTVTGLRNGNIVGTDIFQVSTTGPSLRTPHWSGIDTVQISSSGGTDCCNGQYHNVYFDNIVVNAPEPGTLAIFGLCLATTVLLRRRAG